MYYKTEIHVEPKEGRNLPDAATIGSDMFDVLAEHLSRDPACDFTVVTMTIGQRPESEDEFRSVPDERALTAGELDLLRSYDRGPRIWDATVLARKVFGLESLGLIEPDPDILSAYRLTAKGRRVLDQAGTEEPS
jgi:hypothetical protein